MIKIPQFELGDKVREIAGSYEMICPHCGYNINEDTSDRFDKLENADIMTIIEICTEEDEIE